MQQAPVDVWFERNIVGSYVADIVAEGKVIIEIKAGAAEHIPAHEYQLINYLKATEIEVGLLLYFGKKALIKRKVCSNIISHS